MKRILLPLVLLIAIHAQAQHYLQHADILTQVNRLGGFGLIEAPDKGYIIAESYTTFNPDEFRISPDKDDPVYLNETAVQSGIYAMLADSNGRYVDHKIFQRAEYGRVNPRWYTHKDNVYFTSRYIDSVQLDGIDADFIVSEGEHDFVAQYDQNLDLKNYCALSKDSSTLIDMTELTDGRVILQLSFEGKLDLTLVRNGNSISISQGKNPATSYLLIELDNNLQYVSHRAVEGPVPVISNLTKENNGDLSLVQDFSVYSTFIFANDTIRKKTTDQLPESISIYMRYTPDLVPRYAVDLRQYDLKSISGQALAPNGDRLISGYRNTRWTNQRFVLIDSDFNKITDLNGEIIRSQVSSDIMDKSTVYSGGSYSTIINGPAIIVGDTIINLQNYTYIQLSADSLHHVSSSTLAGDLRQIVYSDERGILGAFRIYGQQTLNEGFGSSPDFKLGNSLIPTAEKVGVAFWSTDCKPLTFSLANDTMSMCADEFGTNEQHGTMKVLASGTGISYQWYEAEDTLQALLDSDPKFQGAYKRLGSQSPELKVTSAAVGYVERTFRVKVGSTCQEPQWSDTLLQRIYGVNKLYGGGTIQSEEGKSELIEKYHNADYFADSIYYTWYLGDKALTDTAKYGGLDSTTLTIKNIVAEDAGYYSCGVYRYHCREVHTQDLIKTYLNVEVNSITDLQKSLGIKLYPNPTNGMLSLEYNTTPKSAVVLNSIGEVVMRIPFGNSTIDTQNLSSGSYIIRLGYDDFHTNLKFIKL